MANYQTELTGPQWDKFSTNAPQFSLYVPVASPITIPISAGEVDTWVKVEAEFVAAVDTVVVDFTPEASPNYRIIYDYVLDAYFNYTGVAYVNSDTNNTTVDLGIIKNSAASPIANTISRSILTTQNSTTPFITGTKLFLQQTDYIEFFIRADKVCTLTILGGTADIRLNSFKTT